MANLGDCWIIVVGLMLSDILSILYLLVCATYFLRFAWWWWRGGGIYGEIINYLVANIAESQSTQWPRVVSTCLNYQLVLTYNWLNIVDLRCVV